MSVTVTPSAIFIRSFINVSLGICHAIQCLTYPSPQLLCQNTSNLSSYLFTWTPCTIFSIAFILLGSFIRLSAFSALGTDFTFRLDEPKRLVTTGLYKYVQHPSYTGKFLIILGNLVLLHRPDGVLGCWLPTWIVHAMLFWRTGVCLLMLGVARGVWKRVKEEEMMLKNAFGKEWKAWHERTNRFIPGLF
jgi:protein-S-isoprenylcysteine O-methyltransferase Ste14